MTAMKRQMTNQLIADELAEMAVFYEMEGVQWKPAAYERAAEALKVTDLDAAALYKTEGIAGLKKIEGVGEGIAGHIKALLTRGSFPEYTKFKKKYPIDVLGMTAIQDIGPKRVKLIYQTLKIKTLPQLVKAAKAGKIATIPHLGKKIEENILKGEARMHLDAGRKLLGDILPVAKSIEERLRQVPGVRHATVAGSVRRMQETIGDLDFIVTTSSPLKVMEAFMALPETAMMIEHGPTMISVRLKNGMRADVRVVEDESYGAAIQYFTGDKQHNIIVRKMAIAKGLMLNEYGLWRGKKRIASRTEEEVYKALGLPYMDPEIRTASGEIEAALADELPDLIPYGSVRGDLQVQTDWTDGAASIEVMAEEARALGMEYIAITDHTRTLAMTGGLDEKKLAAQGKQIDRLNAAYAAKKISFRILKSSEVNILKDGTLDIDDAALAKLDVVGASIHSHFSLPREEQTARMIAAMRNPNVDIIFHPTGRKIHKREPYDIDMDAVLKAAKGTGTAMEIDSYPDRSDLRDAHVRHAVRLGVKLTIDTDAHHPSHLRWLDLGTAIARRGWATKKDVLNTRSLADLLKWFRQPKNKRK